MVSWVLFASADFGSTDPENLLDFVSWGGVTEPTRADQAVTAGRLGLRRAFCRRRSSLYLPGWS